MRQTIHRQMFSSQRSKQVFKHTINSPIVEYNISAILPEVYNRIHLYKVSIRADPITFLRKKHLTIIAKDPHEKKSQNYLLSVYIQGKIKYNCHNHKKIFYILYLKAPGHLKKIYLKKHKSYAMPPKISKTSY